MSKQNQGARTRSGTELRDSQQQKTESDQAPNARTSGEAGPAGDAIDGQNDKPGRTQAGGDAGRTGMGGAGGSGGGEGGRSHRLSAEGFGTQRGAEAQGSFPRGQGDQPEIDDEPVPDDESLMEDDDETDDDDVELAGEDDEEIEDESRGTRPGGLGDDTPGAHGGQRFQAGHSDAELIRTRLIRLRDGGPAAHPSAPRETHPPPPTPSPQT